MTSNDSYFARMRRGEAAAPPISATLGGRITEFDAQACTLVSEYLADESFLNPAGQVQGGMLGAMLDDVTAFLVTAVLDDGEHCSTLSLHLSFLRPARAGALQGRAELVRRGRNVIHVSGELWQDGKPGARATATCMAVRAD
jgi:uncharacterized protein (TIGR00369 family)